jgi:hypothetical protein
MPLTRGFLPRLGAGLIEEHVLIVPLAYQLRFRLKEHRISSQWKALAVGGKFADKPKRQQYR